MFQKPPVEEPQIATALPGERPLTSLESQRAETIIASICSSLPVANIYNPNTTATTSAPMAIPTTKPKNKPQSTPIDW